MNAYRVLFLGFLAINSFECVFGRVFDVAASYALANETTRLNDPSVYTHFICNDTIEVAPNQDIYFRFRSRTYLEDARCFRYSPETNSYNDAVWDFYRNNPYSIYAVGKVANNESNINYSFSLTALINNKEVNEFCEVNLVVNLKTFPFGPVLGGISAVVLLCILAIIWLYRRKNNTKIAPALIAQESGDMRKSNYYENIEYFASNDKSKTVE